MKHALMVFFLCMAGLFCLSTQEDVTDLLKRKGLPQLTARSVDVRGNLLICHRLEGFDPDEGKEPTKLRGLVLLYCDPWQSLALFVARMDAKIRRAAPLMGYEGPGAKFSDFVPASGESLKYPLVKPAQVLAIYVNERGKVDHSTEITFQAVQCKD
jgi:hypothetical protein